MLISVLVPAYNAESTIKRCVDSILCQNSDEFELIVIDDGSTDGTYDLLQRYVENNSSFKIIRQDNCGVSLTRQRLIEAASGEYILFCDADDYMEKDTIKRIVDIIGNTVNPADTCNVDLFVFGYNLLQAHRKKSVQHRRLKSGTCDKKIYAEYHTRALGDLYYSVLWNKCYRKELLFNPTEIKFESLIEDVIFNIDYIDRCKEICIIDAVLYNYNQVGESLTRSKQIDSRQKIESALEAYIALKNKAIHVYPEQRIRIMQDNYMRLYTLKERASKIKEMELEHTIIALLNGVKKELGFFAFASQVQITIAKMKKQVKRFLK